MKLCVLSSGSKGNAIYIEHGVSALIIDQGLSHKELKRRMTLRALDINRVVSILVTHEHSDHVNGVGVTSRALGIPVYATAGSLERMKNILNGSENYFTIESGVPFTIGTFDILPYSVSHDANDPVQFRITAGKKTAAIATDIGYVSTLVTERIKDVDILVIESNYDLEMLKKGSYPWHLKQRIMGKHGHLSNRNTAELLFNLCRKRTPKVILAHLSEENNRPEIAELTIRELFEQFDQPLHSLCIALQNEPSPLFEI